jgi:fumarate reductase flavoprotein subunit
VTALDATGDGRIAGLRVERPDGSVERVACDQLLLACNGFGGNYAMVAELLPEMRGAPFAGHVGNDGSAIRWARQLGARVADLGGYQGHGSWAVPQGVLVSWALMTQGGVQVNAEGRRFHDESAGYSEAAVQVLAQPGGLAGSLFDDPLLSLARSFPDFRDAESSGALRSAADVTGLARVIGCESAVLQATLGSIVPGQADAFGRRFTRVLSGPLHAVKVTGALFHTQGGLDIDARCRVLREDGSTLPNLLAAGGAARGVSGGAAWGYLSGNGLLSAVAGGFIAAQTLAGRVGEKTRA